MLLSYSPSVPCTLNMLSSLNEHVDTENGFVRLEALATNVYVQSLGYGFDGQSAHPCIQLRPSTSSVVRSSLQLRPGEGFHIGRRTFDVVPEEHNDLRIASSGPSVAYYEAQVGQIEHPSKVVSNPSGRGCTTVIESPKSRTNPSTLVFNSIAEVAITGEEQSQTRPGSTSNRSLLETIQGVGRQTRSKRSHSLHPPETKEGQPKESPRTGALQEPANEKDQSYGKLGTLESQKLDMAVVHQDEPTYPDQTANGSQGYNAQSPACSVQNQTGSSSSPTDHISHKAAQPSSEKQDKKKRKLSSTQAKDSQNSLIGSIHVTPEVRNEANQTPKARTKVKITANNQMKSALPVTPIEPSSSLRSTRSAVREDLSYLSSKNEGIRVLFANSTAIGDSRVLVRFLSQHDVKKVNSVSDCTVLCVGKGELKKTSKLIMTVMLGKEVITDDWVTESARLEKLQGFEQYLASDAEREAEWGFDLRDAIVRGRQGLKILRGWTVIFTASAKKEVGKSGFSDLREIASLAGAKSVSNTLPTTSPEGLPLTLVIGTVEDADSAALARWKVYTRDIISLSVLRGNLEIDNEDFLIKTPEQGIVGKNRKF